MVPFPQETPHHYPPNRLGKAVGRDGEALSRDIPPSRGKVEALFSTDVESAVDNLGKRTSRGFFRASGMGIRSMDTHQYQWFVPVHRTYGLLKSVWVGGPFLES